MTAVYEAGDVKRRRSTKAEMAERYDALIEDRRGRRANRCPILLLPRRITRHRAEDRKRLRDGSAGVDAPT
jgi:hypothetical protein